MSRLLSSLWLGHKIFLEFSWLIEKVIDASFQSRLACVIKYRPRYYGLIDRKSSRSNARRTRKNVSMEIALLIKSSFPSNNFFFFFFFFLFLDIYRDSIKHVTLEEKKKRIESRDEFTDFNFSHFLSRFNWLRIKNKKLIITRLNLNS